MEKNPKNHNQIVIKDSKKSNIQFFGGVIAFIAISIFLLNLESIFYQLEIFVMLPPLFYQIVGIVGLSFFVVCGLVGLFTSRQPKLVISGEGILIPRLLGKDFVNWENVDRFDVIEQIAAFEAKVKYIGIFAIDPNTVGNIKKDAWTRDLLKRSKLPTWLIEFAYSPEQIEEVLRTLEKFHNEYKNKQDKLEPS